LVNIWDPHYKIVNVMKESEAIQEYKELLEVAPFQWTTFSSYDEQKQAGLEEVNGVFPHAK
jgi:hypothetical protein